MGVCGFFGRVCLVLFFIVEGVSMATDEQIWTQTLSFYRSHLPEGCSDQCVAVLLTVNVAVQILASLFVLFGHRGAALTLAVFMFARTCLYHAWWNTTDLTDRDREMRLFVQGIAVFGGLLVMASAPHDVTVDIDLMVDRKLRKLLEKTSE
eukprot:gnl/Hemi2/7769_TR2679_c0_g1_i1.p1 gnl/Hemi2/7769_TR2679_c0_g1~~gnl/Hemi2/7769_TR2679_c0_g1_i1.p1  ORF type:complete len:151 (-),score=47.77 gnl/Hemi2/7769_TR2679_c0_g1_i1:112-564(-)